MPEQLFDSTFLKKLEMLTLSAKQLFRGDTRGERRSTVHGASVEFADFRPYVQGDDFRRIDWNAYAKFETLMLRLFVEEQELGVHLLLDCSKSMDYGTPRKFDYARRIAAAIAYMALANTDRVTFTPISIVKDEEEMLLGASSAPMRGKSGIVRMMDSLTGLKAEGKSDFNAALERFALRTTRAGLVIIISDFLGETGYEEGIKRLKYGRHDVTLIHTLAPQELNPELLGDVRLVDVETGTGVDVTANRATMQAYAKRLATYLRELQGFAHRTSSSYVLANTGTSFEDLVLKQFRMLGIVK
jgi:uncharacterized protein (DUF58 family)